MLIWFGFHSIGFPCERGAKFDFFSEHKALRGVSIQLVSPARGEFGMSIFGVLAFQCFHSIGFPCERGVRSTLSRRKLNASEVGSFHSIGFPCERGVGSGFLQTVNNQNLVFPFNWFPLREGSCSEVTCAVTNKPMSFHSIGFPCERGE